MTAMRSVFVDLDGTLIDRPSAEARFLRQLFLGGQLGPRQLLSAAGYFVAYAGRFGRHTAQKNKAYLNGLAVESIAGLAGSFVRNELASGLRPFMLRRLDEHRQAGDRIVLLTGTPDFIAEPLARLLGTSEVIAARPFAARGRFGARPPLRHPFGAAKLEYAWAYCAALGARLADCTAYADAAQDLALLAAVGRAVAVTPDAALGAAARRQGWEVIRPEGIGRAWHEPDRLSVPE